MIIVEALNAIAVAFQRFQRWRNQGVKQFFLVLISVVEGTGGHPGLLADFPQRHLLIGLGEKFLPGTGKNARVNTLIRV